MMESRERCFPLSQSGCGDALDEGLVEVMTDTLTEC